MIIANSKKPLPARATFILLIISLTSLLLAWKSSRISGQTPVPITKLEIFVTQPDPAKRYDSTIFDMKICARLDRALQKAGTLQKTLKQENSMYIKMKIYRNQVSSLYALRNPDLSWFYTTNGDDWYKNDSISVFLNYLTAHVPRPK